MACGSCAARAARMRASQWQWTSEDGTDTSIYTGKYAEVQASAKAKRKGGTAVAIVTPE